MKLLLVTLLLSVNVLAAEYPMGPESTLTPGQLCEKPDSYRYPERIPYCKRKVSTSVKNKVFAKYREELGYRLDISNRSDYKIDHYIPLCAGGSNSMLNLWPQHRSIFTITDPIESVGCEKLSTGRIKQDDLVKLIFKAKLDLRAAKEVLSYLHSL